MSVAENLITSRPVISPSVEFFDTNLKDRQAFRWIAYAGDRISKRRKQEVHWVSSGGFETDSKCIKRFVIMGYVPRGYAALIEQGANVMPEEHMRNVGGQVWKGVAVDGQIINPTGRPLAYTPIFPGDGLSNLIRRAHNDGTYRNGLTELTSLYGRSWEDCHDPSGTGPLDRLEQLCFGDGQELTLRLFREQILAGTREAEKGTLAFRNGGSLDIGKYRAEWLQSCEEFYNWGMAKLDEENTNLRVGTHAGGHVFRYSDTGELLLLQLEVVRQDRSQIDQWREQMGTMNHGNQPQFDPNVLIELGAKLERANQRIAELEAAKQEPTDKPLHWKTREKMEREAAEAAAPTNETEN